VTCVRPVHALWKKTLAAALAPPRQSGAPGFATHARAKSMLLFAGAFGWLESAFHNSEPAKGERRAMLGSWRALSMDAHQAVQWLSRPKLSGARFPIASASGFWNKGVR